MSRVADQVHTAVAAQLLIQQQARLEATGHLLCEMAKEYYLGCKAYHQQVEIGADTRALWHIRLKTLAQIGNQLADVLGVPRPNWPVLYHIAHRFRFLTGNPFGVAPNLNGLTTGRRP
jgi:hypothetical protein